MAKLTITITESSEKIGQKLLYGFCLSQTMEGEPEDISFLSTFAFMLPHLISELAKKISDDLHGDIINVDEKTLDKGMAALAERIRARDSPAQFPEEL